MKLTYKQVHVSSQEWLVMYMCYVFCSDLTIYLLPFGTVLVVCSLQCYFEHICIFHLYMNMHA